MGLLNLGDVKAIDHNAKWFEATLRSKIDSVLKEVTAYSKKEEVYNEKYASY